MLDRIVAGEVPAKHHLQLRGDDGALRFEECFTRDGFDGPFTILYHRERPHLHAPAVVPHGWTAPTVDDGRSLAKRHYRVGAMVARTRRRAGRRLRAAAAQRRPGVRRRVPRRARSGLRRQRRRRHADLRPRRRRHRWSRRWAISRFGPGDYVCIPRAIPHRLVPERGAAALAVQLELDDRAPAQAVAQRASASSAWTRRTATATSAARASRSRATRASAGWWSSAGALARLRARRSPLDVVGWDGTVYPWVFPIRAFQPRVSSVHLPPTWHGTFGARGALVCSFVPRLVDFHPDAIPCPYPHSSPSCDEIIFYCDGNFTSRRGVGPGSVSHHPAGIPHGPHPGSYEKSIGATRTDELAVMVDTFRPLAATAAARAVEDPGYMASFR
jgi:homogentisate 1,2-dioxygenase